MRRFRFRLERVLEDGRRRQRLAQVELAATTSALAEVEARLAEIVARRAALELAFKPGEECTVMDLVVTEQERRDLDRRAGNWRREAEWLEGIVAEQRASLLEIERRVKLLERLRERAHDEHRRLARRVEAKLLDDHTAATLELARDSGGERPCARSCARS
jgi:flagellar export protein FliJ